MNKIKLLFFAQLSDQFGCREKIVDIDKGSTIQNLIDQLFNENNLDRLKQPNYLFAVNESYATNTTVLDNDDILAIIPPVSGG